MELVRPSIEQVKRGEQVIAVVATWKLKGNEAGAWCELVGYDRTVSVSRVDGAVNGQCQIEGGFDQENGCVLHGGFGSELKFSSGSNCEVIAEASRYVRPRATEAEDKPFTVTIMVLL